MGEKYIAYYRVSTDGQGKSGLGLEAQQKTVHDYIANNGHELIDEFVEIESGKTNDRHLLQEAIEDCELKGANLVVSKICRLSRHNNNRLVEDLDDKGINVTIASMPGMSKFPKAIYGAMVEEERRLISERTTEALAAAKARGQKLGNPHLGWLKKFTDTDTEKVIYVQVAIPPVKMFTNRPTTNNANAARTNKAAHWNKLTFKRIRKAESEGATTLQQKADWLNNTGKFRTRRGSKWTPAAVSRVEKWADQCKADN